MNLLFLINSRFDGAALRKRPLGGTETALIGVSCELARMEGIKVTVCADVDEPDEYDGVSYIPQRALAGWVQGRELDVVVCFRQWLPLWFPIRSKARVYFSPDAWDQPSLRSVMDAQLRIGGENVAVPVIQPRELFDQVDAFFCVGKWQAQTFVTELGFPRDKIVVTGNAVFHENFEPRPLAQRDSSILYSATPFRGLAYMPEYFSSLKASFPDLLFEVCSGMAVYGHSEASNETQFGELYSALQTVGANVHGSMLQRDLAAAMCRSRVYTYPNTFAETFCISVLEAQAAGLPVVTSDLGAMRERITHGVDGFIIPGQPAESAYRRQFLEVTEALLSDKALWWKVSEAAIRTAAPQGYRGVAADWLDIFGQLTLGKAANEGKIIPDLSSRALVLPDGRGFEFPGEHIAQYLGKELSRYGFAAVAVG